MNRRFQKTCFVFLQKFRFSVCLLLLVSPLSKMTYGFDTEEQKIHDRVVIILNQVYNARYQAPRDLGEALFEIDHIPDSPKERLAVAAGFKKVVEERFGHALDLCLQTDEIFSSNKIFISHRILDLDQLFVEWFTYSWRTSSRHASPELSNYIFNLLDRRLQITQRFSLGAILQRDYQIIKSLFFWLETAIEEGNESDRLRFIRILNSFFATYENPTFPPRFFKTLLVGDNTASIPKAAIKGMMSYLDQIEKSSSEPARDVLIGNSNVSLEIQKALALVEKLLKENLKNEEKLKKSYPDTLGFEEDVKKTRDLIAQAQNLRSKLNSQKKGFGLVTDCRVFCAIVFKRGKGYNF